MVIREVLARGVVPRHHVIMAWGEEGLRSQVSITASFSFTDTVRGETVGVARTTHKNYSSHIIQCKVMELG